MILNIFYERSPCLNLRPTNLDFHCVKFPWRSCSSVGTNSIAKRAFLTFQGIMGAAGIKGPQGERGAFGPPGFPGSKGQLGLSGPEVPTAVIIFCFHCSTKYAPVAVDAAFVHHHMAARHISSVLFREQLEKVELRGNKVAAG